MSTWTCGLATRLQTTPLFPHARLLHGGVAPTRPTTKTPQLNSTSVRALENTKCDQQSERTGFGTDNDLNYSQSWLRRPGVAVWVPLADGTTDYLLRDCESVGAPVPGNGSNNTDVNLNCHLTHPRYQSYIRTRPWPSGTY